MREEDKPCSLGFSVQAVLLDLRSTHLARDNAGMSVETMTHEIYSKGQFCSRCEGIGFHLIEITYYYYYYQYRGFLRRIRWTMNILVCALRTRASATSAPLLLLLLLLLQRLLLQSHYTSIPPAATFAGFNGGGGLIGPICRLTGGAFITGVRSVGCCSRGGGGFLHNFL